MKKYMFESQTVRDLRDCVSEEVVRCRQIVKERKINIEKPKEDEKEFCLPSGAVGEFTLAI